MRLDRDISPCVVTWTWPVVVTAGLLATAMPRLSYSAASTRADARLATVDADGIGKDPALAKSAMELGRKTYEANCAVCHGRNLKGSPGAHAPDLSDRATLYGSDNVDAGPNEIFASDIEKTVRYGIRSEHPKTRSLAVMPSFAGLDPKQEGGYPKLDEHQIGDLAEYLVSLQGRKHDASAAARGKALFGKGGGCFDCHGQDAKGDPSIGSADLTSSNYLYGNDRLSIVTSIRGGRKGTMPAFEGTLTPAQLKAVSYYLFSVWERAQK
jgi:cytochrome c oxidase cbb3-type subunit 3